MKMAIFLSMILSVSASANQLQPDAKRQREIRTALTQHGYPAGKTWNDTQVILKGIAQEHHWQRTHAPDARVLILLGLGSKHSDPAVLDLPPSILEPGIQAEYFRKVGK
jgi:hypothetical protein